MKLATLSLTGILSLTISAAALAQDCDKLVIKYSEWHETADTKWNIRLTSASGGKLTYLGAHHADDPADVQFTEIKKAFDAAKPTIAFFEGPNRGDEATDTATIKKFGETGYVRFLAKQAGAKVMSLEPSPLNLYQYLVSQFTQEKVDAYFLLNEAMRLRTRKQYNQEEVTKDVEIMIGKMAVLTAGKNTIKTIADLDAVYKKYWGDNQEWWQAPVEWFDPDKTSAETGGIFTNDINKRSSEYRDLYMYKLLADHVNKGEQAFAVVGRNHIPMQEAALRCAVK